MILWGGEKTHLVHYPLRRGELFNLVAVFHSDRYEEGWDTYGDPDELQARFAEKCEPVRTLLGKVESWRMWVLCDRPPIKDWTDGRMTLLGDAAHPMLQYLAQGANMAMEDAVCLAEQVVASTATMPRRSRTTRPSAICARRGCSSWPASWAKSTTPAASTANCATRCSANGWRKGGVDMEWLYGHQDHLPRIETVNVPEQKLSF